MRVQIDDLRKRYGAFELHIPSLTLEPGERVGLIGDNGAGKTTLMRLLLDLAEPDSGTVSLGGAPPGKRRTEVSAYLDERFLLDFLTADEFFAFVGEAYSMDAQDRAEALDPFRSFFTDEMLGRTAKYIRDLSKGNQKKVGLIAAIMPRPRLLILDEPFANLDPGAQVRLKAFLAERSHAGQTLLLASHDLHHVTGVCDRILVVRGGALVHDVRTDATSLEALHEVFAEDITPA